MNTTQKKRLLKLYNHAKQPQKYWSHDKFSFEYFRSKVYPGGNCQTIGCLAGEMPFVFKSWYWYSCNCIECSLYAHKGIPLLFAQPFIHLRKFFGLSGEEVEHLFLPEGQSADIDPFYLKHPKLSLHATRIQVVNNLKRFLKIKEVL